MTLRLFRLLNTNNSWRSFHTTVKLSRFYENDRRSDYPSISDFVYEPKGHLQRIRDGYRMLKEELSIVKDDCIEKLRMDPVINIPHGEVDVHWKFDGNPKMLEKFVVTTDKDMREGNSVASLELSPCGSGIFSGILDNRPIRDGKAKKTGYCNIRTVRPRKAFYFQDVMDWSIYTHLIMRIRGDGRTYMINLRVNNTYDVMWNDLYNYALYTRGGPYWQYVKIPFSKFLLSHRGRIQDKQGRMRLHDITTVSITIGDDIPGPFRLEIDFIGTERDFVFEEDFAYELYKAPNPYYI